LREEQAKAVGGTGSAWKDDSEVDRCQLCDKEFNLSRRKVSDSFITKDSYPAPPSTLGVRFWFRLGWFSIINNLIII
jgi:hypothetical protein